VPAFAQTAAWKEDVKGWFIGVDRSVNDGCFMQSPFEGGGVMRVGFDPSQDVIFVLIGDDDWRSLEIGKLYPIEFQFGQRSPWTVEAGVFSWEDGDQALQFTVPFGDSRAEAFVNELQQTQNIRVRYEGREIINLSLRGSSAAMQETINCQANMIGTGGGGSDPFNSNGNGSSDPFQ
jgi:hypothetical protein